MCLEVSSKKLIATEDIVAYKIIRKDSRSIFQDFLYEPHTRYNLGWFSNWRLRATWGQVHKGFHSYEFLRDAERDVYGYQEKVIKVIIPKGTAYFRGSWMGRNNYASAALVTTEL